MSAVLLVVRVELCRRWRSVLVLALLVGIGGGATLAAVAGARRTASAFDRFLAEDRPADVLVNASSLGPEQLDEVERLPQVAALARLSVFVLMPEAATSSPMTFVANVDGRIGRVLDRGRVVAGRRLSPEAVDEVMLSESAASTNALGVGSRLRLQSLVPAGVNSHGDAEYERGPRVKLRVVGISRSAADLAAGGLPGGAALLTPAFFRHYRDRIVYYDGIARVRLHGGASVVPTFIDQVGAIYEDPALSFEPLATETAGVSDAIDVLALALVAFAMVAGIAASVAVGLAIVRQAFLVSASQPTLRALGLTPTQRLAITFAPATVIAVCGAGVAVCIAIAASALMPMGLARRADPDLGLSIDALVLVSGACAIMAVVATIGLLGALRAVRLSGREARSGRSRSTGSGSRSLTHRWSSPVRVVGIRAALEPGRGHEAVPARPALGGGVVAVVGIVVVLTLSASLESLIETPSRYGWAWDATAPGDSDPEDLQREAGVAAVTRATLVNVAVHGRPVEGMGLSAFKDRGSTRFPAVLEGRAPRTALEVALGTETMNRLPRGRSLGDRVEISGPAGRGRYRIVGRVVVPSIGVDLIPVADGAVFTSTGIERLTSDDAADRYEVSLVSFAEGREDQVTAHLFPGNLDLRAEGDPGRVADPPPEVRKLQQVEQLPIVLAVLLALLAVGAIGHAIVTTVHRRRRDLAILKTLGFTRRQLAATVAWQASTPVVAGLVIGIPLGIAVGRWIWINIADQLGVVPDPTVPVVALALMVPMALVLANVLAVLPGRAAGRTSPAAVLRSE
jgi:hypothetical protein